MPYSPLREPAEQARGIEALRPEALHDVIVVSSILASEGDRNLAQQRPEESGKLVFRERSPRGMAHSAVSLRTDADQDVARVQPADLVVAHGGRRVNAAGIAYGESSRACPRRP